MISFKQYFLKENSEQNRLSIINNALKEIDDANTLLYDKLQNSFTIDKNTDEEDIERYNINFSGKSYGSIIFYQNKWHGTVGSSYKDENYEYVDKTLEDSIESVKEGMLQTEMENSLNIKSANDYVALLLDTLIIPNEFTLYDTHQSASSFYFFIREITERDEDGDISDYGEEYKIRLSDHSPSPFRGNEFGNPDYSVVLDIDKNSTDKHILLQYNWGITKIENWLQNKLSN